MARSNFSNDGWPISIDSCPVPTQAEAAIIHEAAVDWAGTVGRAKRNLLDFTRFTKPGYVINWHHKLVAEYLDDVALGRLRRLLIVTPPRMGKTELVSIRQPALRFGQEPNIEIIGATYNQDRARDMSLDLQSVMESDEYQILFGQRLPEPGDKQRRTQDAFRLIGGNGRYKAVGVGVGLTGSGGDLCLVDDLFKDDVEAMSATHRDKVWRWYTKVLYERLGRNGAIVGVMTRWHRDDWMGRLLRMMHEVGAEKWELVWLPALRPTQKTHSKDPRKEGEALWPWRRSRESLLVAKKQDPAAFAAIHQGDPSEAGGTDWPPELFGEWIWCKGPQTRLNPHGWPADFDLRVVTCDPSKGRRDKPGDYTAIIFLGLKDRLLYVDAIVERIPMARISDRIITFCDQWHPHGVAVEGDQFQEFLCHDLKAKLGDRYGLDWGIEPIMSEGVKKEARIRRLSPFIVDRQIRFRAESSGCRLLVEQLLDFPTGEHDDGPDALEMAVRKANKLMVGQWE